MKKSVNKSAANKVTKSLNTKKSSAKKSSSKDLSVSSVPNDRGVSDECVLFARLRQVVRTLTNFYNGFMPDVSISSRQGPKRTIPLKVTQLIVMQALYDTSWWQAMRKQRVGVASTEKRELLDEYYEEKAGYVVQVDLARYLQLDCTSVSRNLKVLVESGWVEVKRSDVNMRETMIALTESGRSVVAEAFAKARLASEQIRTCLGAEFIKRVDEDLSIMADKVEDLGK